LAWEPGLPSESVLALGLLLVSALVLALGLNGASVWVWDAALRLELVWWRVSPWG
jgi:hypothetical protein